MWPEGQVGKPGPTYPATVAAPNVSPNVFLGCESPDSYSPTRTSALPGQLWKPGPAYPASGKSTSLSSTDPTPSVSGAEGARPRSTSAPRISLGLRFLKEVSFLSFPSAGREGVGGEKSVASDQGISFQEQCDSVPCRREGGRARRLPRSLESFRSAPRCRDARRNRACPSPWRSTQVAIR